MRTRWSVFAIFALGGCVSARSDALVWQRGAGAPVLAAAAEPGDSGTEASKKPRPVRLTVRQAVGEALAANRGVQQARLWETLDKLRTEISDDAERSADETRSAVTTAESVVLAVSSGLLTLLLRGGSLVAAAVSSLPMWRRVDPLAVLSLSEEERRKREREQREARASEDEEGAGIGELFDDDDPARDAPEDEDATQDKDETD